MYTFGVPGPGQTYSEKSTGPVRIKVLMQLGSGH